MRFRLGLITFVLLGAILACNTPGASGLTTTPSPTAQVLVVTATPPPATSGLPPTPAAPGQPSGVPSAGSPSFSLPIRFATAPTAGAAHAFKAATRRIYAVWDYAAMTGGLKIRREWYLNGDLWLKREEPWDIDKYGASGTIRDISIYDEQDGLPTGQYELRLFIDDQPQFAGDADLDSRSFTVGIIGDGPGTGPGPEGGTLLSPDAKIGATIENNGELSVVSSGQKRTLVTGKTIDGYAWLPDSAHIVYSTRSEDGTGPFGVSFDLFIVDVATAASTQLNHPKENLHMPVVSPDGRSVALLMGTGFGDACVVDQTLAVLQLDPAALTRSGLITMDQFSGLTPPTYSQAFVDKGPDFAAPGVWQSATQLKAAIRFTYVENGTADGLFTLDISAKSATKSGPLPQPQ